MSDATVTYMVEGQSDRVLAVDVDKHSLADLLEACRRRIFPGEEPPVVDPVFDRIMADRAKPKKPGPWSDGKNDG